MAKQTYDIKVIKKMIKDDTSDLQTLGKALVGVDKLRSERTKIKLTDFVIDLMLAKNKRIKSLEGYLQYSVNQSCAKEKEGK